MQTGGSLPARAVEVQRRAATATTWSTMAAATSGADGAVTVILGGAAGVWDFRVVVPLTQTAASATTPARRVTLTADTTAPDPVAGLSVGGRTAGSIALSWSNPAAADLYGIVVRRATGAVPPASVTSGSAVTTPARLATSVVDSGLTGDTEYAYAVFAEDAEGNVSGPATLITRTPSVDPAIAAGHAHSCALWANGTVRCWGANDQEQLGDGTTTTRTSPVMVEGITSATAIAAGYSHTCVVLAEGTVKCWGADSQGQLGSGSRNTHTLQTVVGVTGAVAITAGDFHACALISEGTIKCWGDNSSSQLGDGSTTGPNAPVLVSGVSGAMAVSAGAAHTCAVLSGGTVTCWGANRYDQLGSATPTTTAKAPLGVPGISGATAIVAGSAHTCALLTDGGVACWGANAVGQAGGGSITERTAPVTVVGILGASAITAGAGHSCALIGGEVRCWGNNGFGQLGDGTRSDAVASPMTVTGVNDATAIAAGDMHTCALRSGGTVSCWGDDRLGQLGHG